MRLRLRSRSALGERRPEVSWPVVVGLSTIVTTSYGVLMYAFPVVLGAMEAELGWSRTLLTGGYSLAALMAGLASVPVGRWVDRRGSGRVMGAGALAAPILLVLWARVQGPWIYLGIWTALGLCMAVLFYEPAFAELARAATNRRPRARALGTITIVGGMASVVFVPLTAHLLGAFGWRSTVLWLAGILALLTLMPHALTFRPRARPPGRPATESRRPAEPSTSPADTILSRAFPRLCVVFGLTTLVSAALSVHLIPLLMERGHSLAWASGALAWTGVAKISGRILFTSVAERFSASAALAGALLAQVLGLGALLVAKGGSGIAVAIVLSGAADGAATPARGVLVAEAFDLRAYGSIQGAMGAVVALSRAAAPIGASAVWALSGDYVTVLWLALAFAALGFLATLRAPMRPFGRSSVYMDE